MKGKKLYRSVENRKIYGVCGGIAELFGIDATVIRLVWALFGLCYGIGVLFYFIAAFIIPVRPDYIDVDHENINHG